MIGSQLTLDPSSLTGSWWLFAFGLVTALWAGMKAFAAAQIAMDDTWEVPLDRRPNIANNRLRALAMIGVLGAAQIAGAAVSAIAGGSTSPPSPVSVSSSARSRSTWPHC